MCPAAEQIVACRNATADNARLEITLQGLVHICRFDGSRRFALDEVREALELGARFPAPLRRGAPVRGAGNAQVPQFFSSGGEISDFAIAEAVVPHFFRIFS